MNGNSFLTSFYKLSRFHEKILLGLPVEEDIGRVDILRVTAAGDGADGSRSGVFSRGSSSIGGRTSPVRRSTSRCGKKLPKIWKNGERSNQSAFPDKNKHSAAVGTDMLSSFKYSGVFSATSVEDFADSRSPAAEDPDFPFDLDSPRRGLIKLSQSRLPSRHSSPRGNKSSGMLASMFSGVNPWTASSEDLSSIGVISPSKKPGRSPTKSPSPTNSRVGSPMKRSTSGME